MWLTALLAAFASRAGAQSEQPTATPYRPSVSTPASLSAPGWLELETGWTRDRGASDARRDSLPYALKLAFTPDWGVRITGEAWVRQRDETGESLTGAGDSSVIVKRRFAVDDASAFGVEFGRTAIKGRNGIGSGGTDYTANTIYSADFAGTYHTDLNLAATHFGLSDGVASRYQLLWAAALSKSLGDRWSIVGELSGTHQHGVDATAQALAAISFNATRCVVLDVGLSRSLRSGVPDWSAFTGATVLLGRIY